MTSGLEEIRMDLDGGRSPRIRGLEGLPDQWTPALQLKPLVMRLWPF